MYYAPTRVYIILQIIHTFYNWKLSVLYINMTYLHVDHSHVDLCFAVNRNTYRVRYSKIPSTVT